jgi:hypothetical protein
LYFVTRKLSVSLLRFRAPLHWIDDTVSFHNSMNCSLYYVRHYYGSIGAMGLLYLNKGGSRFALQQDGSE